MKTYNKLMNITNVKFDEVITYSDDIEHFTEIKEAHPIRNNVILYKSVTGIGATHSEIVAQRDSIIVLPHISIITSKSEYYLKEKNIKTLAIHGNVTIKDVYDYFFNLEGYAKILTTPKGLDKVIYLMNRYKEQNPEMDYKKLFFILMDECHKVIQDAEYRTDMLDVMNRFFEFENKAMVSATPIPPSDQRFVEQGFRHIKLCPKTTGKHRVELLHTNSLVNGMKHYLLENIAECYCIFFNSIIGINSIINQLELSDYRIYCSKESKDVQMLHGQKNVSFELDQFKRFNFFTSSFFNGLDIIIDTKPNIVILTDSGFKTHTLIDPYTDTLQVIGRFRKKHKRDIPYNKITHINNSSSFTTPISEEEAIEKVNLSDFTFNHMKTLKYSLNGDAHYDLFDQALKTVLPYYRLINKDYKFSYFKFDNYLDDERVKNYYTGAAALHTAYYKTKLFELSNDRQMFDKEEIIRLQNQSIRYSKDMNKQMAEFLLELEDYQGLDIYHEQRSVIEKLSYIIFEAYKRLGYDKIVKLKYSKSKIEKELQKLNIEEGKDLFPVIDLMQRYFELNKAYTCKEIKNQIQNMFNEFNINCIATAKDVERYFKFKTTKKDNQRAYVFLEHKQSWVNQQKHV